MTNIKKNEADKNSHYSPLMNRFSSQKISPAGPELPVEKMSSICAAMTQGEEASAIGLSPCLWGGGEFGKGVNGWM